MSSKKARRRKAFLEREKKRDMAKCAAKRLYEAKTMEEMAAAMGIELR